MHSAECSRDSRRILVGLLVGRFGARILYTSKSKVTSYFFQLFQYCVAVYSRLSAQTWPTSRNPFFYIPFHRVKPALCLKLVSMRVSVVAPKSEHVRMIHAWTGHKLSKRFKLAARGKRRKRKKKATKCLSLWIMQHPWISSRLIGDPLGQQPPFYSPRGRVSWRETVSSFDFIFALNLFTRTHALDLCGHAKRRRRRGQASRRSDPRRKNSFLVNEIRFQWPPPVPPSRATFPFRYQAKKVRGMCLSWNVLFHKYKYFWSFSANFTRIVHAIYFERRMQLEINSFLEIISFREIWRLELCINY